MSIYQVDIAVCPNCKGDMLEDWQHDLDEWRVACPNCKVSFPEEHAEHRTEYHRQIVTTDDGGGTLIELQRSDSPDMAGADSGWYRWTNEGPIDDDNFTGIDDQFASIMAGCSTL